MDTRAVGTRPPMLHFVWTGRRFPYHARLAIESAVVAMPDAVIRLHLLGERPVSPDLDAIEHRIEVTQTSMVRLLDGCPDDSRLIDRFGSTIETPPAAVSNIARLAILWREGGVYLDTDTIVLTPLDNPHETGAYVGAEWVWERNRRRVAGDFGPVDMAATVPWAWDWMQRRIDSRVGRGRWHRASRAPKRSRLQLNNAVIGAPPGSAFVASVLTGALDADPSVRFALGPSLLDDVATALPGAATILPPTRFYAVPPGQSFRFFEDRLLRMPPDAQVIHYVASNHRRLLDRLHVDDRRFDHRPEVFWSEARRVRAAIDEPVATLRRIG